MLNGKFYTGLPPGMIERRNASTQQNRMQSSIFWPDDTKVDSALETRVKRHNSLQIAQAERPQLLMQTAVSGGGDSDVNTRQLFQKDFSKSSIEFLDNLCDETKARKPLLLRGNRSANREVTPKPTALNLPLPENVVNEGYTTAKKKQAFTSKIEFYDYARDDELNNRNNLRRAKMDMNDKKEMERNTKNSLKLQVKNNVRSLTTEERLYPAQTRGSAEKKSEGSGSFKNNVDTVHQNNVSVLAEDREVDRFAGRDIDNDFESGRRNCLRDENLRDLDNLESRRTVSPAYDYRREERLREVYEDDYATRRRNVAPVRRANSVSRFTSPPKRILKQTIRERRCNDYHPTDGYRSAEPSRIHERYRERNEELYEDKAYDEPNDDVDYMDGHMRNMRIRTSPQKHVTYSDDTYSHDEGEIPNSVTRRGLRTRAPPPNMRNTGSDSKRQQQQQRHPQQLRRYDSEIDLMEDVVNNEMLEQTFVENDIHDSETPTTTPIKSLNITNNSSYNNNNRNKSQSPETEERELNNNLINNKINTYSSNSNNNKNINTSRLNNQKIASAARKITPKITTIKQNTDTATTTEMVGVGGVRKHLRSSLCLHNGEIIASDDGGGETSSAKPAPTRNARSMATRQRINVGLPD
ncbi:probable basic-leucine zipper transcription factor E [Eurosta solidaginis]|uniref:probable basic-leucine zipper transcription factor E n=1 Tax=Eurosta solidaginis TaxID=178769 RepID=UPI003530BA65